MASETTLNHWKVVFSWGKMRKKGPNSKPPHLLILIVWILSLHIIICQLQIKSTVIHSFCSLHVPDKCASIFKMLMLLGSLARRRMSSLNIWWDSTIISSWRSRSVRRYYLHQKVVADVLGLTEYLDNYKISALWEGQQGQSGCRECRSWEKKRVSTKASFSNSMFIHPF